MNEFSARFSLDNLVSQKKESPNKPLVYLASPYSDSDEVVVQERFELVSKKAAELMMDGMIVFSPIAHCHPMATYGVLPTHWAFWEKYDRAILSCCHKVIVLKLVGWEKSTGVQAEIKIALEMGLPVEYIDL
jgi:hypothetical protein